MSNSRTTLLQTIFNDVEKYAQHCKNHPWNVKCLGFDINTCKEQKFQFAVNIEHTSIQFQMRVCSKKVALDKWKRFLSWESNIEHQESVMSSQQSH